MSTDRCASVSHGLRPAQLVEVVQTYDAFFTNRIM
jgi:hypothetical protein